MNSAGPYTEALGQDIFNNGRGRARPPGVPRNGQRPGGIRLRRSGWCASRAISSSAPARRTNAISFGLDAFNVVNRVNYAAFVGTLGSPLFERPVSARPPRQLQASLRIKF
jgi:hypothetical protein